MRDFIRHPDVSASNLGALCLRAVASDERFDDRVRGQAEELLKLRSLTTDPRGTPGVLTGL